jgi:hypothetical protein
LGELANWRVLRNTKVLITLYILRYEVFSSDFFFFKLPPTFSLSLLSRVRFWLTN